MRPVLTDAQMFALFVAASDTLKELEGTGLKEEIAMMHTMRATPEEVQSYLNMLDDLQRTFNEMYEYFIKHPEFKQQIEQAELPKYHIKFVG